MSKPCALPDWKGQCDPCTECVGLALSAGGLRRNPETGEWEAYSRPVESTPAVFRKCPWDSWNSGAQELPVEYAPC